MSRSKRKKVQKRVYCACWHCSHAERARAHQVEKADTGAREQLRAAQFDALSEIALDGADLSLIGAVDD